MIYADGTSYSRPLPKEREDTLAYANPACEQQIVVDRMFAAIGDRLERRSANLFVYVVPYNAGVGNRPGDGRQAA